MKISLEELKSILELTEETIGRHRKQINKDYSI